MADVPPAENVPLPKGWPRVVRSAILQVVGLAQMSLTYSRSWAADSRLARVRLQAALDQARSEVAMLAEELRIKDARVGRIDPRRRPNYPPTERLAILELRAARCWSAAETARRMFVEAKTIASWTQRVDEEGPNALVQTEQPVNRYPEFVQEVVAILKRLCPRMGKKRIAQELARAGLHLGVTTVKRMFEIRRSRPPPRAEPSSAQTSKPVIARRPNHVWQVDLTILPRMSGLWVPWFPFAQFQRWPFAWWVAVVVDQFSRKVMGWCVFPKQPTSLEVRMFLGRAMGAAGATPRYLLSDKGVQFTAADYRDWCERKGIRPRYASKGSLRATAVIERFFRSLKSEMTCIIGTALTKKKLQEKLALYFRWFEEYRPHQGLDGRTPREVFYGLAPANRRPRFEPRPRWPRESSCAHPLARPKLNAGGELALTVEFADDERQLPIVTLRRAA
jgi:transposase InsO family protein